MRTKIIFKRLNAYISLCLVMLLHVGVVTAQNTSPLCFTARNGSVTVRFDIKNVTHTIQYSTDSLNWNTYTSNSDVVLNTDQSVYFRSAINHTVAMAFGGSGNSPSSRFYFTTSYRGKVEGSGNILSLYGPDCPNLPLPENAFKLLFEQCNLLTTAPSLPATTLAKNCYFEMFYYCTSLTVAPSLPATSLAESCYFGMFYGCSSLTTLPELSATTLADYCYMDMFDNCSSLCVNTSSPGTRWIISAVSTATNALQNMFVGTGGTMNGTPSVNITYYVASAPQQITVGVNDTKLGYVSGAGAYQIGNTAVLTAIPFQHYHFGNWSDGDTTNPRYVNVVSDSLFTAFFEPNNYSVSVSDKNGTVTGTGVYTYNTTATLIATPNEHYHVKWSDDDTSRVKSFTVTDDTTLTSVFEIDKHTITAYSEYGAVTGVGTYDYGSTITLSVEKGEHYHFARWSDGDTTNPRQVTVVNDSSFTVVSEPDDYMVSVSDTNGIVTGTGLYSYNTTATLTAIPDEHHHFDCWPDGDTSRVKSFTVMGDTTFTSLFANNNYTISSTCKHGTIAGNGVYEYEDIVTLSVTPDNGYKFVEWSDGNEYNPRIFVVEGDLEVEAICAEVVGVENVEESVAFYYVSGRVVNPEGVMLRVYSTEGKMVKSGDGDIVTDGLPAEMYMVVDERGRSLKVVVKP